MNTNSFHLKVSGDYNRVFSFKTSQDRNNFLNSKEFKGLKEKMAVSKTEMFITESYKIGEDVNVLGDGTEIYKIEKIQNNGSIVVLNTGFRESSYKLHKDFINAGMV